MTSLPWRRGGAERQHRVFDSTVRALKWLFPLIPGEAKDSVSVKKLLAGEGDWECVKEVLGWTINTEAGAGLWGNLQATGHRAAPPPHFGKPHSYRLIYG